MLKHIIAYGACALILVLILNSWHEKDKQVDALKKDLEVACTTIEEKDKERERENRATAERDEEFDKLDKKLDAVHKNIRSLAATSKELRDTLNMRIPPALLRELRTYGGEHKAEGAGTLAPKTGVRK